ncbi:transposase, partial [Achromobacter spanius]
MARNPKSTRQSSTSALPASAEQLLDELVTGPMTAEAVQDTFMLLKKALIERALGAELGRHLGYPAGGERPEDTTNQRNGKSSKTVLTDDGP